jgi:hypothetical protein
LFSLIPLLLMKSADDGICKEGIGKWFRQP